MMTQKTSARFPPAMDRRGGPMRMRFRPDRLLPLAGPVWRADPDAWDHPGLRPDSHTPVQAQPTSGASGLTALEA